MSYIRTFSGVKFYPLDPNPADVLIEDIAHALSRLCRWVGHVPVEQYSVGLHSMHVCDLVGPNLNHQLAALLHDASEAYLGDIAKPVKVLLPDYKVAENRLMACISQALGFEFPLPEIVHQADAAALFIEAKAFSKHADEDIEYVHPPHICFWPLDYFVGIPPSIVEDEFLAHYKKIKQNIHNEKTPRTIAVDSGNRDLVRVSG